MSKVKPFKAYRPPEELAQNIAAPPYDVINSEEARQYAKGNPYSFLHVAKPEIDLPKTVGLYEDAVYEKGAENLMFFIKNGWLEIERKPSFYIYRQVMNGHGQDGIVCLSSVKEYEEKKIKIHEFTRKDKEDDRTRHVMTQKANAEPVFLTYRAVRAIDEIVNETKKNDPVYDIRTEDGILHQLWVLDDAKDVAKLTGLFGSVPALYVADGHHRTAAAVRMGQQMRQTDGSSGPEAPFEYFMAVLFPHNQLKIMDYNRVVKDLNGLNKDEFLKRVSEKFEISDMKTEKPAEAHSFGMFLDNKWHKIAAQPGTFDAADPIGSLDVSILQENLLSPVLGIKDPRTDKRIDFVGGIRGMKELERRVNEGWAVAFSLYPTTLDQLLNVADAEKVMPPKSTWFEPKLRSGLFVRLLEE
jgi:uncharacterized protein (DUF1015 family)